MRDEAGWKLHVDWLISCTYDRKSSGYQWTLKGNGKRLLVQGTRLYQSKAAATKAAFRDLKSIGLSVERSL